MSTMTPHGRSAVLRTLGWATLLAISVHAACLCFGVRLNTTASLPIGLYVRTSDPNSTLIEFCPTGEKASMALSRGYRSPGVCPDGGEPLMKPIVAEQGDIVRVSPNGISVNSILLSNSQPRKRDTGGRALSGWPLGTYPVAKGTIWTISSFNARSFDSRYLGPVKTSSVRAHLKPLLIEWVR